MPGSISKEFISELVLRVDIVECIQKRIKLKKSGVNYTALCPFHQEKSPSFVVSPQKQCYHCFGCNTHGDAIDFVQQYDKTDFITTIESLAASVGLTVPKERGAQIPSHQLACYHLLKQLTHHYQGQLKRAKYAIDYLVSRGLSGKTCLHYGVGFASDDWQPFDALNLTKASDIHTLRQTGMLIKSGSKRPYARFRNRIMFPIRNLKGQTIAFGGRYLNQEMPKYMNSPETPIFHKRNTLYGLYEARKIGDLKRILIVEGYLDVLTLFEHGITWSVAALGTAISQQHLQLLMRYTTHITFCFDGDSAGQNAARKTLDILLPITRDHIRFEFLTLPPGEDPDSFIQAKGSKAFYNLLDQHCHSLSHFMIKSAIAEQDITKPEIRAIVTRKLAEQVKQMPHHFLKQFITQDIAVQLKIEPQYLAQYLERATATTSKDTRYNQSNNPQSFRVKQPVHTALALLVQQPKLAKNLTTPVNTDTVGHLPEVTLLLQLIAWIKKQMEPMTSASLLRYWQGTSHYRLLRDLSQQSLIIPEENKLDELKALLKLIKQQGEKIMILNLLDKMKDTGLSIQEKKYLQRLIANKV